MPQFNIGDIVQRVNAAEVIGCVVDVRLHPQLQVFFYDVETGTRKVSVAETQLRAFHPGASPWDELRAGAAAGARAFRSSLTRSRVGRPPSRIAKSFSSARTQFYPHQFLPLLKFMESPQHRLLIGDDVGLGKTIEAGYILTELAAAGRLEHVLIVVPSRLREKWRWELEHRFGLRYDIVAGSTVRQRFEPGAPTGPFRWIASYEGLRTQFEQLKDSPLAIDCVVFDEAHRLRTPTAAQHRVGALLCERSEAVVMLSATPIQTSLGDLFQLAKMLLPTEFADRETFESQMSDNQSILRAIRVLPRLIDDTEARLTVREELATFLASPSGAAFASSPIVLRASALLAGDAIDGEGLAQVRTALEVLSPLTHFFTRTRKADAIPNAAVREPQWMEIVLEGVEKQIYQTIVDCCRANAGEGWGATQSKTMVYRAVASCIPAAMRQFQLGGLSTPRSEESSEEPETDEVAAPTDDLRTAVRQAIALFERLGAKDSKLDVLVRSMADLWSHDQLGGRRRRKCIVFSYFRGTVEYLFQMLSTQGIACKMVHGGVDVTERATRVNTFLRDPNVDVLITTDVSAEGVDLQRASAVFNYDLPWNPMVVEQRIGRIDRIGQEAQVLAIVNLVHRAGDTFKHSLVATNDAPGRLGPNERRGILVPGMEVALDVFA